LIESSDISAATSGSTACESGKAIVLASKRSRQFYHVHHRQVPCVEHRDTVPGGTPKGEDQSRPALRSHATVYEMMVSGLASPCS
jgi:hypothetical protein